MAANDTRLLLLGAVAIFGPVNGYQIRRELLSWQVDQWAKTNPGSIYGGLNTLTRAGKLSRTYVRDGERDVAVYQITAAGRTALHDELLEALREADPYDRDAFAVAFALILLVPVDDALAALDVRREGLNERIATFARLQDGDAPPHAVRGHRMWLDLARAELAWLDETISDMRDGKIITDPDDPDGWRPAADDPGWQMTRDRQRYEALLHE